MTAGEYYRVLLIFADGVGLAPAGETNPLSTVPTPALQALLGGPMTLERLQRRDGLVLTALDAGLGIDGLPQSATGQTALFTGVNGAERLGRHVTGLPGPRLREIIDQQSLFKLAVERGLSATFANAYSAKYVQAFLTGARRPSVTTCAVEAAGLPFRGLEELRRGEAITWDVTGDRWIERSGEEASPVEPIEAGRRLGQLARRHRLTVYETFLTDVAGHSRFGATPAMALERLDGLLAGALAAIDGQTTLVLTSDHGNLEVAGDKRHTRNPVPLLAVGPQAGEFSGLDSILGVTPAILRCLDHA